MKDLIDKDGENRAVRAFLLLYGGAGGGVTVEDMRDHLECCGFPVWPSWVNESGPRMHLTKGGAQDWLRSLFALETGIPSTERS